MRTFDPSAVLLVVDVQNDFADPNGSLYVRGGEQVVPLANAEISRAVESDATVMYTQDWHPPSTPHFQKDGGIWPVHCVQGTWGAELHRDLEVAGEVVRKGEDGAVDRIVDWCHRGPELAHVEEVEVVAEEPRGEVRFRVDG